MNPTAGPATINIIAENMFNAIFLSEDVMLKAEGKNIPMPSIQ